MFKIAYTLNSRHRFDNERAFQNLLQNKTDVVKNPDSFMIIYLSIPMLIVN